jgi:hypothetical protein
LGAATQSSSISPSDTQPVPLQPVGYVSSPIVLHSSGNEACEQIVCKVSPLPSPLPSPVSSCSNIVTPSCSVMTPLQPLPVEPSLPAPVANE